MRYNAYWTLFDAPSGTGRRLTRSEHDRLAQAINAHIREAVHVNDYIGIFPALRPATHLGAPCIRMEARSAGEARLNVREVERFVRLTGYRVRSELTSATQRAL